MLLLQNLGYAHPNKDVLFDGLNLAINDHQKIALVGHNGVGKSTLLQLLAGLLAPSSGRVQTSSVPYYIPQHFGQFNNLTVAQALRIEGKIRALQEILSGLATDANMALLDDDWTIEERSQEALLHWGLADVSLTQPMASLSGGQKTKVFLAGITIHQPDIILLDEPSNHLDTAGRQLLYDFIKTSPSTLLVVSHDRKLLHLLDTVCELSKRGLALYGGNYEFYAEQKQVESNALSQDVKNRTTALRKARETEREALERKQKLDARGKKNQDKAGLPTIMLNMMRNSAEQSTSRLKGIHAEKVGALSQELSELRKELPDTDKMKFGFDDSTLHKGKILISAAGLNYSYGTRLLWPEGLSFQIQSGERLALRGLNGSGKTTLIKLLLGHLEPTQGTLHRAVNKAVYIDQEYSLLQNQLSIYEQAQQFNTTGLQEHEVKIRLSRFLFTPAYWDKPCSTLSGGEKMRLLLCCLMISQQAPDLIILDEPTNNLDIQNLDILAAALHDYHGTLLVVSHDEVFLEQLGIEWTIQLA
ncbi:ATPase components of ABC transporters with duplicated ATPase domains [Hymenobacter gelipurpurascens]|uniref:ATPase components of ABC transporters with duplicated ATPase domains n=1 Tax=Hymenobacter gelipurpurascens TaxID=89968 RepID=A0A212TQW9_9BACT|nr:ABC-F family ATP-binding cassette domain-containing protein [Hymenobacter gelipurpurascens]SNC68405.1 ATPase components of ABC transporters with duplicated ATPase domains [Hymenobacter gelipurpurascens]